MAADQVTADGSGRRIDQAGEQRSARIESLRAIAALGVLVTHVYGQSNGVSVHYLDELALGASLGVFLFFALSGYLLFWPFAKRDYGGGERIDIRRYALNRALRILPLYYFVMIFLLLVQEKGGTFQQWALHTTFGETFSTETLTTESVNGVVWSLVVEIHFYALLPLLAIGIAKLSRGSLGRAALMLAGLGLASFVLRLALVTTDTTPNLTLKYSIPTLFFFFVAGMLLALLRVTWRDRPPAWLRGSLGSSSLWCTVALALMLVAVTNLKLEALAALASFLVVGACVLPLREGWAVRALEWRWLAAIGVASYSLYLWHLPVLRLITNIDSHPNSFAALLLLSTAACIAVAFVSYRLAEAPWLTLRRRWARSSPAPDAPLAARAEPERV